MGCGSGNMVVNMAEVQRLTRAEIIDRFAAVPPLQKFRNSTVVTTIRRIPIMIEDIALACAGSGLNLALMGRPGIAKSLFTRDVVATWFAGRGVQFPCHFDMKPKDIFEKLNLERTAGGKLTLSASTLTGKSEAVGVHVIVADDINRAPEVVQAPLQQLAEAYIEIRGQSYQIGDGYCTFLASANHEGSDRGAFQITPPMRQRLHIILDTDCFPPRTSDLVRHAIETHEPKAYVKPADSPALTPDVPFSIARIIPSLEMILVTQYLQLGLDHCARDNTKKRMQWRAMPGMCQGCQHLAQACGYILPVEPRIGDVIVRLTIALQLVAEAKAKKLGLQPNSLDWHDTLQVFSLVAPSVDVYNATRIREHYRHNAYRAIAEVTAKITEEMESAIRGGSLLLAAGSLLSEHREKADRIAELFTRQMGFVADMLRDPESPANFGDQAVFGIPRAQLIQSVRNLKVNGTTRRQRSRPAADLGATLFDDREEDYLTQLRESSDKTELGYALIWLGEHGSAASLKAIADFFVRHNVPDADLKKTAGYQFYQIGKRLSADEDLKVVFSLLNSSTPEVKELTLKLLISKFDDSPALILTFADLIKKQKLRIEDAITVLDRCYAMCSKVQTSALDSEADITDSVMAAHSVLKDISSAPAIEASTRSRAAQHASGLLILAQRIGRTRAQASARPIALDLLPEGG